jgi:hypothetical protein
MAISKGAGVSRVIIEQMFYFVKLSVEEEEDDER